MSRRQAGRQGLLPPGQHLTHDTNIPHVSSVAAYLDLIPVRLHNCVIIDKYLHK